MKSLLCREPGERYGLSWRSPTCRDSSEGQSRRLVSVRSWVRLPLSARSNTKIAPVSGAWEGREDDNSLPSYFAQDISMLHYGFRHEDTRAPTQPAIDHERTDTSMRKKLKPPYVPPVGTRASHPDVEVEYKLPTTVDINLDPVEMRRATLDLDPPVHGHDPFDFLDVDMWDHMVACLDWLAKTDRKNFMRAMEMKGKAKELQTFLERHSRNYMARYDDDHGILGE